MKKTPLSFDPTQRLSRSAAAAAALAAAAGAAAAASSQARRLSLRRAVGRPVAAELLGLAPPPAP